SLLTESVGEDVNKTSSSTEEEDQGEWHDPCESIWWRKIYRVGQPHYQDFENFLDCLRDYDGIYVGQRELQSLGHGRNVPRGWWTRYRAHTHQQHYPDSLDTFDQFKSHVDFLQQKYMVVVDRENFEVFWNETNVSEEWWELYEKSTPHPANTNQGSKSKVPTFKQSVQHSDNQSNIQTISPTFRQSVQHSNNQSNIQTISQTFKQSVQHSNNQSNIQTISPTFKQSVQHSNNQSNIQTISPTFRQSVQHSNNQSNIQTISPTFRQSVQHSDNQSNIQTISPTFKQSVQHSNNQSNIQTISPTFRQSVQHSNNQSNIQTISPTFTTQMLTLFELFHK
ncbi:hypothetical protein Btru_057142, partial [Bulinus truncatus]